MTLSGQTFSEPIAENAQTYGYTESMPTTQAAFVQTLLADEQAGRAAVFGTNNSPAEWQLVPGHAYMVNGVVNDSTGAPAYLELRNP